MTKLQKVVASAVASAGLLLNVAWPVLAQTTIEISGNGADSTNTTTVGFTQVTTVVQDNFADVDNHVTAEASTGGNDAEDNTGGDVSIETGDAKVDTSISNSVNTNSAEVSCCGAGDADVLISGNGSDTTNSIDLGVTQVTNIFQGNEADVHNDVYAKASTGGNDADDNTGGSVSIETGDAEVLVDVATAANANSARLAGGGSGGSISARILGNGVDSDNLIDLGYTRVTTLTQDNFADIDNHIYAKAKTGGNDAEDNTGGDVSIETGDAKVDVSIDNMANFNWADVDCGGCLLSLLAKIAGNGSDSDSEIKAGFTDVLSAFQTNSAASGELDNEVYAKAKTGGNDVEDSTGEPGGDPTIETGDATVLLGIENSGNANVFGEAPSWFPEFPELPEFDFGFNWAFFWAWLGLSA